MMSACTFAQSDQNLYCVHFGQTRMQCFFMRITKTAKAQADLCLC